MADMEYWVLIVALALSFLVYVGFKSTVSVPLQAQRNRSTDRLKSEPGHRGC